MDTHKGINELIKEFLLELDCKSNTIATYRRTLAIWVRWMTQNANIKNPTKADMIRYKTYLVESHQKTTVDNYLASVKLLFKWLNDKRICDDVIKGIHQVSRYKGYRRGYLTPDQVSDMLSLMKKETLIDLRNFAIVNLMVRTGLRCSEVISLNVCDFILKDDRRALSVQRKGHNEKDSPIGITPSISIPILKYLNIRGEFTETESLFASESVRAKAHLSTATVSRAVMSAMKLIGIKDKRMTAHSLRHSAAINALQSGKSSIYEVQQMLGHSSPNTTMIYLRELERENLEAAASIRSLDSIYQIRDEPPINV